MEENQNAEQNQKTDVNNKFNKLFSNKRNVIIFAVVAVVIAIILICLISYRSPKATINKFVKQYNNGNEKKIGALIDIEGLIAYTTLESTQEKGAFAKRLAEVKKSPKEEKEAVYNYEISNFSELTNKIKCEITNIKKDENNKGLTIVESVIYYEKYDISVKVTFVTYQKGLKNYIIHKNGLLMGG